eukprot:TRINITY_DN21718_c0_g1_i1.p1 TRINITY_DN21718_c0_g1~~TRINITY_DN21718_c0_g1_i1.p1  ORF type:complete len:397 (+),score=70.97 TRINITY_DN21718_c0_g1_i1:175-1191(+)
MKRRRRKLTVGDIVRSVRAFVSRFQAKYVSEETGHMLNFFIGTFPQALEKAARENKMLFVYLHSEDHSETDFFCSNTLTNPLFCAFINNSFVVWGGDLADPHPSQLGLALRAKGYPFIACVGVTPDGNMRKYFQREGFETVQNIVTPLQYILTESDSISQERMNAIQDERLLRKKQDEEYALELIKERERVENEARKVVERAKEEQQQKERDKKRKQQTQRQRALFAAKTLRVADSFEKHKDQAGFVELCIRLPTGKKITRKFWPDETVSLLYDFVDTEIAKETAENQNTEPTYQVMKYSLLSNWPTRTFDIRSQTLQESGLAAEKKRVLHVRTNGAT